MDPGKSGAIAMVYEPPTVAASLWLVPMPIITSPTERDQYDVVSISDAFRDLRGSDGRMHVFVEKQQPFPAMTGMSGGLANFYRGYGLALLEGVLATLKIPYELVPPKRWQKVMLAGIPGEDTGQRAIIAAKRLFPDVRLQRTLRSRKDDEGFADALLIAEYGRRQLAGR